VSTHQKAYEVRPNRAVCYPNRKRQEWMSGFVGVVSLSETGDKYWVNIWQNRHNLAGARYFALRLRAKDNLAKTYSSQLRDNPFHPGQYVGTLALANGQKFRLELWEDSHPQTGRRYLRAPFELIERRTGE
jgi:hypothetical protein